MIMNEVRAQTSMEMILLVGGMIFFVTIVGLIAKALLAGTSPGVANYTNTVVNQLGN